MALNQRPDRGKLNLIVLADGFGSKIARWAGAAAKALVGMMIDDAIGIPTDGAAVTFMTRLGAARLCPVPTRLAVARRWLGRRA
ncbi:hypothetical protein ASD12_32075 [Mesorhizobium sp. Root102]|nr:hypothetical protein ASD12_32075 [Mesorhizobium sp. Root102]